MEEQSLKAQRGGAYRVAPRPVASAAIYGVFCQHLSCVAEFGIYESLSRNTQPDGAGLVKLESFLASLLAIAPTGEVSPGVLKKAYEQIVFQHPRMNTSAYHNGIWAAARQERLTTALCHLRRLGREPERLS